MTKLDINKHLTAEVNSDSVRVVDDQNGEVVLADNVFERLYQQYLEEQDVAPFVEETDE